MTTPVFIPCTRCGANINPYGLRAIKLGSSPIDLCGHHAREHQPALTKQGWTLTPIAVVLEAQREIEKAGEPA